MNFRDPSATPFQRTYTVKTIILQYHLSLERLRHHDLVIRLPGVRLFYLNLQSSKVFRELE